MASFVIEPGDTPVKDDRPGPAERNSHLLVVALFLALAFLVKAPTLQYAHREADEIVYFQLAQQLYEKGTYSLQGTDILKHLPPAIYDRPLFHHPPVFPVLLIPFVALRNIQWAVFASWLGHGLCIVAVALIAREIQKRRGGDRNGFHPELWVPLVGVSRNSIMRFQAILERAGEGIALDLHSNGHSHDSLVPCISGSLWSVCSLLVESGPSPGRSERFLADHAAPPLLLLFR
jgi:hypothetical protein